MGTQYACLSVFNWFALKANNMPSGMPKGTRLESQFRTNKGDSRFSFGEDRNFEIDCKYPLLF